MAYNPISDSEVAVGSPLDNNLLLKIKANFEAQQTDLISKQNTIALMQTDLISKQAAIDSHTTSLAAHGSKITKQVPVGTVRSSTLSLTQFQSEVDGVWMLMNGQSCTGTAYATMTGNATVPDMMTDGTFLRQAKSGRSVGSAESDAIRNITGTFGFTDNDNQAFSVATRDISGAFSATHTNGNVLSMSGGSNASIGTRVNFDASLQVPTATENRPKNTAVNFFIKVGY